MDAQTYNFHGVVVRLHAADDQLLRRLRIDYGYFLVEPAAADATGEAHLTVTAHRKTPDYDSLPALRATIYSPRNICYTQDTTTYIDYFGKALSVYDRAAKRIDIYSDDLHLLHETVFMTFLSRVGELLERRKMHRVHGLCFEKDGRAFIFMAPSGCGKTTLGMALMKRNLPLKLVSEDSPLLDRHGQVLPFPLRLGIIGERPEGVADEHVTQLNRTEGEAKHLIAVEALGEKVATGPSRPRLLLIGDRSLGKTCVIERVGFFKGLRAMLRHLVVGVGIYQGVEFLLRTSVLDLVRMMGLFFSRLRRGVSALRQSAIYVVYLGRDRDENTDAVVKLLEAHGFGAAEAEKPATGEVRHAT